MKAFTLLIITYFCVFIANAQVFVNQTNINLESATYCSVKLGSGLFMNGYHAFVDYGQSVQNSRNRVMTDEYGEKMVLHSKIHLLNFMASNGWKFVEVLEDSDEDGTSFNYVFRKEDTLITKLSMEEWDCIPQL